MPPLTSRRSMCVFVLVAFSLCGVVPSASAAPQSPQIGTQTASASPATGPAGPIAQFVQSLEVPAVDDDQRGQASPIQPMAAPRRLLGNSHWEMVPLSAAYATLQGLDVHSTLRVLNNGGSEANPIMASLTAHPAAFIALKATMAGTLIYSSTKLSRRNRVAAALLMAGLNTFYGVVVAHNYGVARSLAAVK